MSREDAFKEDARQFLQGLRLGHYDQYLDQVASAVKARQKIALREIAATLGVGDLVVITNCRPKYLVGLYARVAAPMMHGKIEITLEDGPIGRFGSKIMALPEQIRRA